MAATKGSGDWLIVRRYEDFVRWCAWRQWLAFQCGMKFFPAAMTVLFEWPPQTRMEVEIFVGRSNQSRERANNDSKVRSGRTLPTLLVDLDTWQKWGLSQIGEYEHWHRLDRDWLPPLSGREIEPERQVSHERMAAVIASARAKYPRVFKRALAR